jgi:hypothetical protein
VKPEPVPPLKANRTQRSIQFARQTEPLLTAEAVEDQEALETSTLIGQFTDSVEYEINDFLADGVVATSVVVGYSFIQKR